MSDIATFFRHREKDSGETYRLQFETGKSAHRVSIYARKPLPFSTLRNLQVKDKDGFEVALRALRKDIAGQGGGGWLVTATDEGSSRRLSVAGIAASGFEPASRFFMLSPGRPTSMYDTGDKTLKVPLGSHAIVPVDEEATAKLGDFLSYLSWLPNDMESVVLNAIRRPSLDARLDRVETEVFGRTAAQELRGPWTAQAAEALRSKVVRVAAVVLIVMMFGVAVWAILHKRTDKVDQAASESDTGSTSAGSTATSGTSEDEKTKTAGRDEQSAATLGDDTRTLLSGLEKSTQPVIKRLYDKHFKGVDVSTNQKVDLIYRGGEKQRPFLWGLIKLQVLALRRDLLTQDLESLTFLNDVKDYTGTKAAFDQIRIDALSAADRTFLAATVCRCKHGSPPAPGLPLTTAPAGTPQDQPPYAAIVFAPGQKCTDYTKDSTSEMQPGIRRLRDFVGKS